MYNIHRKSNTNIKNSIKVGCEKKNELNEKTFNYYSRIYTVREFIMFSVK